MTCHEWDGYVSPDGYGRLSGKMVHRLVWAENYGPIPEGMEIDHTCFNRRCYNVAHLEMVTPSENTRRAYLRQTTCRTGRHPKMGLGRCRECVLETNRRGTRNYRLRKKEVA